jgi:hypothetical protein
MNTTQTQAPAALAAFTPEEVKKIKQHKTAFIVLLVLGILWGIGVGIGLTVQEGNPIALLIAIPFAYVFPAFVAGALTFPTYNKILAKCLTVPLIGWVAWFVLLDIGLSIWAFVGIFTLPHQVKKLKRELKALEGGQ